MYQYMIWQLPLANEKCFRSLENNKIYWDEYVLVYVYETDREMNLEKLFEMLNINHPRDYYARSLSVSDLVMIRKDKKAYKNYIVDIIGFSEVEVFDRD